ncbi:MAG: trypsin-like peptidase domain-containing protein [Chitinophagaceae bacterium]|nr:trypsin-like peptidase domain-containing protein [Chitinophagaceae bacterium]
MKYKQLLVNSVLCIATAFFTLWMHDLFSSGAEVYQQPQAGSSTAFAGFRPERVMTPFDFTEASEAALPSVVHIKAAIKKRNNDSAQPKPNNDVENMFEQFFGVKPNVLPEQRASGSGVIVRSDGYIITNNHVIVSDIDGALADEINVTLANKSTYRATVVGRDARTDLAVLKIEVDNLPVISFGNSDQVKTGQWALAVGYPLSLDATVTAGIVSGKGRSIGVNMKNSNDPVEDFIQTDAVINSGSSGGALVSADGKLIGINSAMLSANGTYAGYGFAISVNLVKKVIARFIKTGGTGSEEPLRSSTACSMFDGRCSMADDRWLMAEGRLWV